MTSKSIILQINFDFFLTIFLPFNIYVRIRTRIIDPEIKLNIIKEPEIDKNLIKGANNR